MPCEDGANTISISSCKAVHCCIVGRTFVTLENKRKETDDVYHKAVSDE